MKRNIFGIIGLLGSGKSEVLKIVKDLGFTTINSDTVVKDLYLEGNPGWQKIVNFFGDEYLDKKGNINKNKLRNEVLKNPNKLRILNKLIHPLVVNEFSKIINKYPKDETIFIEIPVFNKKLLSSIISKTIEVKVDPKKTIRRIKKSRENPEDYKKLLSIQKKSFKFKPDYVIDNNRCRTELKRTTKKLLKKLKLI